MKRIKIIFGILTMIMLFATSVNASSFNLGVQPENIKAVPGETIEIQICLEDIDMKDKGINTVEGYIRYDEDIIESIEIVDTNDWKMTYNNDRNSNLYGKFLSLKEIDGIKQNEEIAKIKVKIKDKIYKEKGEIKLEEITSNDGESLVNIGQKIVQIEFEKEKVENEKVDKKEDVIENIKENINTGDILPVVAIGIIVFLIIINIILKKKTKK